MPFKPGFFGPILGSGDINNPSHELVVKSGAAGPNLNTFMTSQCPGLPNNCIDPRIKNGGVTTTIPPINPLSHSILPASGFYDSFNIAMRSGTIPESLSSAKWSDNAKGFPQQTFLGASIRSFTMQGGFGDSSSSLTVDLVVDEYNDSDLTLAGKGDDVYHSGIARVRDIRIRDRNPRPLNKTVGDNFVPPIPGSPVFFKFGPNLATVEEAYRKTFDDTYGYNTMLDINRTIGGVTTLKQVLDGIYNIAPDTYVDLTLPDIPNLPPNELIYRTKFNYSAMRRNPLSKGKDHIVFGGILQNYNQNRTPNGNPLYTVNVIDPREILSNVTLILNNYAGPTYEQSNILNIYGFLEYNPTQIATNRIKALRTFKNELKKTVVTTGIDAGLMELTGDDKYYTVNPEGIKNQIKNIQKIIDKNNEEINALKRLIHEYRRKGLLQAIPVLYTRMMNLVNLNTNFQLQINTISRPLNNSFPITGTGFSRRSSQGIPFYRVKDAINALMEFNQPLDPEYKEQGFGGKINFRGFNYVVDFSGLPELPEYYYLDFDEINLLELALEICDITNRDLFVSLLPIIDHPACKNLYNFNQTLNSNTFNELVAGIIRIDTIDRSEQPIYGAIKNYIDGLAADGVFVENQDLGYELSNVVTDKFIVGAQEVDMYYFSTNADRDTLAFKKTNTNGVFPNKPAGYQWTLEASLEQQVLPYYGKLGNNAVTIPKGFGPYQQILLDSSSLNAAGVGAYYVATEMELRCAMISFDRWKEFLKLYNDTYMDSVESDDTYDTRLAGTPPAPIGINPPVINISKNYSVTVPRSVFDTYAATPYGDDGLPSSPCNPPYGYPLYYKRMTKIGIPEGGLVDLFNRFSTLTTNLAELRSANNKDIQGVIKSQFKNLGGRKHKTFFEQQYYDSLKLILDDPTPKKIQETIGTMENIFDKQGQNVFAVRDTLLKKNTKNALKVYDFVKSIANECLGKKFLVKIPTEVNLFYDKKLRHVFSTGELIAGPFGFRPRSTKNIAGYEFSSKFKAEVLSKAIPKPPNINMMQSFLSPAVLPNSSDTEFQGALKINYNPLSEKYESNYTPTNIGGYFDFDLYQNTVSASGMSEIARKAGFHRLPSGVQQGLIPQDLTNFINEDGRVSPYVRFDHSQFLSLEGLNDSDFTQQIIASNYMVPDLSDVLDNTGEGGFKSFPNTDPNSNNGQQTPKAVAFVKCSVDEQLYLPPRLIERPIQVHGQQIKDIGRKSVPRDIFIPCSGISGGRLVPGTGVTVDGYSFYQAHFVPLPVPGSAYKVLDFERYQPFLGIPGATGANNTFYVNTDKSNLNTEHVYALITLPNRVLPSKDSRLRDGPFQSLNAERFKHLMTMDVVRDLPGFNVPQHINFAPRGTLSSRDLKVPITDQVHAWFAMKKHLQGLNFGSPHLRVNVTMPSPVYPDLVALPLMSQDRCYGPWISSQLDEQAYLLKNIGGKVDFIKNENLSPWNYGGYQLMDQAGRLEAEFSNSLLLFSERGSFTIPSIPKGNSLCRALSFGGPLVTSINVDVSTGGARTTYQMDLYTASFGKLQKQKQEEISKISRQRKKLNSERNALIRKGLGKNQSSRNFLQEYNILGGSSSLNEMGLGQAKAMSRLSSSVARQTVDNYSSSASADSNNTLQQPGLVQTTSTDISTSIQDETMMGKTAQLFNDQFDLARAYFNSASTEIGDLFAPASDGYHPNMSYRPDSRIAANHALLSSNDETANFNDDIAKPGANA